MNEDAYRREADALDAEILRCIERRSVPDFNDLALRVFAHQLRYNAPYARYCEWLGVTLTSLPQSWEAIPPMPTAAYKEAALCTFDAARAALAFVTSGTSAGSAQATSTPTQARGTHYMESATLYEAALLASFHDAMLHDAYGPLRYLLLAANPAERPHSSLGYMAGCVAERCGDGAHAWYVRDDVLAAGRLIEDARSASAQGTAVCMFATAFALVQLLDALAERHVESLPLHPGSRIMETGGFKGRTRSVERAALYAQLSRTFELPEERIVAEYGMTELTSQYYDAARGKERVKRAPSWMRPRVVGPSGQTLPPGVAGTLVHVDLANRSSCVAIQTQDVGVARGDGGIVLLGREARAEPRGCSLDAEQLRTFQRA